VPLYEYECPLCGKFEILQTNYSDQSADKCPECGNLSERVVSLCGFKPFVSFWSEALCPTPGQQVEIRSRAEEMALCKANGCVRAE
jgi:putative FmdB family regulatory protein